MAIEHGAVPGHLPLVPGEVGEASTVRAWGGACVEIVARRYDLGLLHSVLPKVMEREEVIRFSVSIPFPHQPEPAALGVGDAFPPAGAVIGGQGHGVAASERLGVEALVLEVHEEHPPRNHRIGPAPVLMHPGAHVEGGGHEAAGGARKALDRTPALFLRRPFHPVQLPLKNLWKGQGPGAGKERLRGDRGGPGSVGLDSHESLLRRVVRGSRRVQRSWSRQAPSRYRKAGEKPSRRKPRRRTSARERWFPG